MSEKIRPSGKGPEAQVTNISEVRKARAKSENAKSQPPAEIPTLPTPVTRDAGHTGYERAVRKQILARMKAERMAAEKAALRSTLKMVTEENAADVSALALATLMKERINAGAIETPLSDERAAATIGVSPEEIATLRAQVASSKEATEAPPEVETDNVVDLRSHRPVEELPVSHPHMEPRGIEYGGLTKMIRSWLKLD